MALQEQTNWLVEASYLAGGDKAPLMVSERAVEKVVRGEPLSTAGLGWEEMKMKYKRVWSKLGTPSQIFRWYNSLHRHRQ